MPKSVWLIGLALLIYLPMSAFAPALQFMFPQIAKWYTLVLHAAFLVLLAEASLTSAARIWLAVAIGWFAFCGLDQFLSAQALDRYVAGAKVMNSRTVRFDPAVQDLVVRAESLDGGRQIAARLIQGYDIPQAFDFPDPALPASSIAHRYHACAPYERCIEFLKSRQALQSRGAQPSTNCFPGHCLYRDQEVPQWPQMRIDAVRERTWMFNSKIVRITVTSPDQKTTEFLWGLAAPRLWFPLPNTSCFADRDRRCDAFKLTEDTYLPAPGTGRRQSGTNLYTFVARAIELDPVRKRPR